MTCCSQSGPTHPPPGVGDAAAGVDGLTLGTRVRAAAVVTAPLRGLRRRRLPSAAARASDLAGERR